MPFFMVPGNHDGTLTNNHLNFDNYHKIIGPTDIHWAIDLPTFKFKLIGLNTMYHNIYKEYGLTKEELKFLRLYLLEKPARANSFVVTHVPPREPQLDWVGDDAFPNGRGIVVINIQNRGDKSIVTPIFVPVGWSRASEPVAP